MKHEIKWQGGQWQVTSIIGGMVIARVYCEDYGAALDTFCQLAGC